MLSDHLGSVRLVAKIDAASADIVEEIDYDEFGVTSSGPVFQPFGYAGGLQDGDAGFVRFGARDYDAATGRWNAKDPIGFGGSEVQFYRYSQLDPINLTDVTGGNTFVESNATVAFQSGLSKVVIRITQILILGLALTDAVDDVEDEFVVLVDAPSSPMPSIEPPKDPGEFLRLCIKFVRAKFQHQPIRLAIGIAKCVGLILSH